MTKVQSLAHYKHPIATVCIAKQQAGAEEARYQLAMLASLDLEAEPPAMRALVAQWRAKLLVLAGQGPGLADQIQALGQTVRERDVEAA